MSQIKIAFNGAAGRMGRRLVALAAADPGRWAVVDGAGSVGEVRARVQAAVDARFPEPEEFA